eukprot:11795587-Ditylum_brightwellii.AAC.1
MELFLNHPLLEAIEDPITMQNVQQHQFVDLELNKIRRLKPELYPVKHIEGHPLICIRHHTNESEGLWKIVLPAALLPQ